MKNVFSPHTRDAETPMPARRWFASAPGWVKVAVVLIILLILVFLVLHLTGNGFGNHMQMSIREYGGQLI
jgi:hypothetical protein